MYIFSRTPSFPVLILVALIVTATASRTCSPAAKCIARLEAGRTCPLIPMVPGSFDPPVGPQGFRLTTLRPGVFHYSDDAYHSLILYNSATNRLAVIDFPRSQNSIASDGTYLLTVAVLQVLKGDFPKRVDMVYSHRHFDHIGFAGMFKNFLRDKFPTAKVFVWGTLETKEFIRRKDNADVPLPGIIIGKRIRTLSLSRFLKVKLSVLGGHTESDVLAYIPRSHMAKGVIHFPDIVTAGEVPFIQFTLTIDLGRYLSVHRKLLKLDFDFFSTGHGMIGNKNDVRRNLKYTESVIEAAKQAARSVDLRQAGTFFARIADPDDRAYRNGAWALKSVLDLQVRSCTKAVIQKWGCRLSAVDVFAEGHCLSAVIYNFVDQ